MFEPCSCTAPYGTMWLPIAYAVELSHVMTLSQRRLQAWQNISRRKQWQPSCKARTHLQGKFAHAWAALMQPSEYAAGMRSRAHTTKISWRQINNRPHAGLKQELVPSLAHQRQRPQPVAHDMYMTPTRSPDLSAGPPTAWSVGAAAILATTEAPVSLRQQKEDNAKRVVAERLDRGTRCHQVRHAQECVIARGTTRVSQPNVH